MTALAVIAPAAASAYLFGIVVTARHAFGTGRADGCEWCESPDGYCRTHCLSPSQSAAAGIFWPLWLTVNYAPEAWHALTGWLNP
jgi:hypothetical protein